MKKTFYLMVVMMFQFGCSQFGQAPGDESQKDFKDSKQYNPVTKKFDNRIKGLMDEMKKENLNFSSMIEFFKQRRHASPAIEFPQVKPDMMKFLVNDGKTKLIWLGHSSFLINMGGKNILLDPVFSQAASPFSFAVKRFQQPPLTMDELPPIDFIVISHDHYDHLDMETIKNFVKQNKTQYLVPLGVGSHLRSWGVKKENIFEMDWWDTKTVGDLEFVATPSQHGSGRALFDMNSTLWASWVIKTSDESIYFSGDSGYDDHFKDIGEKYGPFDIALIESGQYNEKWWAVHLLPRQFETVYRELKAKKYLPIHWGTFDLSLHPWFEPVEFLSQGNIAKEGNLVTPQLGQVIEVNGNNKTDFWWKSVMPLENKKLSDN